MEDVSEINSSFPVTHTYVSSVESQYDVRTLDDLDDNMRRLARGSHHESPGIHHSRDWKSAERHLSPRDRRSGRWCTSSARRPFEPSDVRVCCAVSPREEAIVSDDEFLHRTLLTFTRSS